ncbi:hypothetical protein B296_00037965 [Ensete ventricosum]|uniref:Uncharacterized protein n=1 Tax=Ensete ventricosum TaxID=4639 RepID=A0A426ZXZ5_ENSVE|nr:hypothetical protein B296_00037965 [Ensete ventricosum]
MEVVLVHPVVKVPDPDRLVLLPTGRRRVRYGPMVLRRQNRGMVVRHEVLCVLRNRRRHNLVRRHHHRRLRGVLHRRHPLLLPCLSVTARRLLHHRRRLCEESRPEEEGRGGDGAARPKKRNDVSRRMVRGRESRPSTGDRGCGGNDAMSGLVLGPFAGPLPRCNPPRSALSRRFL